MALTPPWLPALQRATAVLGHKLPEDAFLALVLALATHRPPDHPRHILLAAAEGSAVPTVATIVGRVRPAAARSGTVSPLTRVSQ